jgi:thymidylate kinase
VNDSLAIAIFNGDYFLEETKTSYQKLKVLTDLKTTLTLNPLNSKIQKPDIYIYIYIFPKIQSIRSRKSKNNSTIQWV